jgi:lipopolysaccharide/colanic/teichoic acid biosynthesis glycosyltransferase
MIPNLRKSPPVRHDATLTPWPQSLVEFPTSSFYFFGKRSFDLIGSLVLLLVALPIFALVALLVTIEGDPVLYVHQRVGRGGKSFGCLKFRTMLVDGDRMLQSLLESSPSARREWESSHKLRNDPRITRIGAFLRQYSLDELPQLLNVLRGEMSLVGPRPVVASELDRFYGSMAAAYMSVRPGITGPWQVSGRSSVHYDRRVALDIAYAASHSFAGDLVILGRTVGAVLSRRGAH